MRKNNEKGLGCRQFLLVLAAVFLACAALGHGNVAAVTQTDGPLVGAVTDRSAKIFARTNHEGNVAIEYSKLESLEGSSQTAPVTTSKEKDWTAIILVDELERETTYYYAVLVDGVRQQRTPYPSFTTFPRPGSPTNFSFATFADLATTIKFPDQPAPAYARAMRERPAFVLQIGDFDHRNPQTLEEMRMMHREVRGGGAASAAGRDFRTHIARSVPLFHVWDDHDYGMNNSDKTFFAKASSLRAFKEYYPTPELAKPDAGIWHKFSYGEAEFFMIDDRSQRDPDSDIDDDNKSMLDGDGIVNGQKDWLKEGLLKSKALWKFVMSGVPFNPTCKPDDSWGAFNTERNEILGWIRDNCIRGVIVISGDLHSGGAIDDGTNSGVPEISVPHTNLTKGPSGPPGEWSQGVAPGDGGAGYAIIKVLTNPDRVILEAKAAEDGKVRKHLMITLPETLPESCK